MESRGWKCTSHLQSCRQRSSASFLWAAPCWSLENLLSEPAYREDLTEQTGRESESSRKAGECVPGSGLGSWPGGRRCTPWDAASVVQRQESLSEKGTARQAPWAVEFAIDWGPWKRNMIRRSVTP